MGELRKDYILDRYVIIATERGKRPHQLIQPKEEEKEGTCYFCPGNENMTPPEIYRVEENGKWKIRVFPNKFAAVQKEGEYNIKTDNTFFTFSNNYGTHEIIVETPDHEKELADLPIEHIKEVLKVFSLRIEELSKQEGIKYVQIFKNKGSAAGASIAHTHCQVIAYNIIPTYIKEKINSNYQFDYCPHCKILHLEKGSYRSILETQTFVSFAPYASRFPLEAWIYPKRHVKSLSELNEQEYYDFSKTIKHILTKLQTINVPYNIALIYSPKEENLHLHMEIIPRISKLAGFEFGTGNYINHISPEDAAKFYKE